MSKVFMIIGKSFSGKDTLLNYILENQLFCEKNNLHKLVRYTTRKIRPNEVEGQDYHFIDDIYYFENFKDNDMCVTSSYNTEFGHWYYVTDLSRLDKDKNYILTGDIESVRAFKEILGDNLCLIWLLPPDWVLFERFAIRDDNSEYAERRYREIQRRYVDDLYKFTDADAFIMGVTTIINLGKNVFINIIERQISKFIDGETESVIISKYGDKVFNSNFKYNQSRVVSRITSMKAGIIAICNNKIILDTANEKYSIMLDNYNDDYIL